jgi:hypothetical protein
VEKIRYNHKSRGTSCWSIDSVITACMQLQLHLNNNKLLDTTYQLYAYATIVPQM